MLWSQDKETECGIWDVIRAKLWYIIYQTLWRSSIRSDLYCNLPTSDPMWKSEFSDFAVRCHCWLLSETQWNTGAASLTSCPREAEIRHTTLYYIQWSTAVFTLYDCEIVMYICMSDLLNSYIYGIGLAIFIVNIELIYFSTSPEYG